MWDETDWRQQIDSEEHRYYEETKMKMTTSKPFKNATPGMQQGVCTLICDLGTQPGGAYGPKRKILMQFEVEETLDDGRPMIVQTRFTRSWHPKGLLRQAIENWRGAALDNEFEMEVLLGRPAMLNLVESQDGKYINIKSISPLPKSMTPLAPSVQPMLFDLEEPDWGVYENLSEYQQKLIADSPEYRAKRGQEEMATDEDVPF